MRRTRWRALGAAALLLFAVALGVALRHREAVRLLLEGDARRLRPPAPAALPEHRARPDLLVLALDGVPRHLLYEMLRSGELPGLSALLGGRDADGTLPHAHLVQGLLATLPSATSPAWSTAFTGVPPAVHGVTGNEFFIREQRRFVALIPISFQDLSALAAVYTEGALNRVLEAPTVYQQLRALEPRIRIWVAMSQVYQGADRLLLADRAVLIRALTAFAGQELGSRGARAVYEEVDEEVFDNAREELARAGRPPDVLTVYLSGTDQYAHVAE
ncbi:MAG TPA: alkaline phosphatase family protein, partial [Aggregicoccus sp.]|nr:alkaline phosphatase family protein [Aggregicoccus sp.]